MSRRGVFNWLIEINISSFTKNKADKSFIKYEIIK